MPYLITHRHRARDCGVAFAAWRGFESPLRHTSALATCRDAAAGPGSEHVLFWTVEADSPGAATAMLPPWLAERSEVQRVVEVEIP